MMTKTDWLQRFLGADLVLRQPLMLNARVNDHTREIYLEGDIPAFSYNGAQYTDGIIQLNLNMITLERFVPSDELPANNKKGKKKK